MTESAMQGAADAFYVLETAQRHLKHILNEQRDAALTEPEWIALLDVYEETGR